MGQYLSSPITEKEVKEGHNDKLAYGLAAMQGWRVAMEDDHVAAINFHDNVSLFSVFDGHGGKAVAKFCAKHLMSELKKLDSFQTGDLPKAITDAYFQLDVLLDSEQGVSELKVLAGHTKDKSTPGAGSGGLFTTIEESLSEKVAVEESTPNPPEDEKIAVEDPNADAPKPTIKKTNSSKEFYDSHLKRVSLDVGTRGDAEDGNGGPSGGDSDNSEEGDEGHSAMGMGCTAVSALVKDSMLIVANTGDSRCVLSKRGVAEPLTLDHKPILLEEAQRIIKAGGFVRDNRVNGALNVSRTIGDLDFKRNDELPHTEQMVVATPDIAIRELMDGDEFLIIACDGIWDVLSNQEAVEFVRKRIKQGMKLRQICEQMCDYCLAPDLKGLCRGADNMSVIIVMFKKYAKLDSVWSKLWGSTLRVLGVSNTGKKQWQSV